MNATYRHQMAERVSNHDGSSYAEVMFLVNVLPLSVALCLAVKAAVLPLSAASTRITTILAMEFAIFVLPQLWLNYSTLGGAFRVQSVMLAALTALQLWFSARSVPPKAAEVTVTGTSRGADDWATILPSVTVGRASLMLATCTSILAVDFPQFPARHMKVETFGVSYMDIGVGCFVFYAGVVRGAKLQDLVLRMVTEKRSNDDVDRVVADVGCPRTLKDVVKVLRSSILVLFFGVGRMVLIAITGYHEHVSEYGAHWNFFITLGLMPWLAMVVDCGVTYARTAMSSSELTQRFRRPLHRPLQWVASLLLLHPLSPAAAQTSLALSNVGKGICVLVAHQFALSYGEADIRNQTGYVYGEYGTGGFLTAWLLSPHRRGFVEANKEGIVSLSGYLALFYFSQAVGSWLMAAVGAGSTKANRSSTSKCDPRRLPNPAIPSWGQILKLWVLLGVLDLAVQRPSRRFCNAAYVVFVLATNVTLLRLFEDATRLSSVEAPRVYLLEALSKNQLVAFVVANLTTGFINLAYPTLAAPAATAGAIMVAYLAWVCGVACCWDRPSSV